MSWKTSGSRWIGISSLVSIFMLVGCSAPVLQSVATSMATASLLEKQKERVELQSQMQAETEINATKEVETAQGYLQLIAQMQRQEMWFASLAHLDAYEARWSSSDESRVLRADALRHAGKHQESAHLYTQLLEGSQASKAHHGLGLLAVMGGAYSKAIAHFEQARRLIPTDAMLLNDLALAHLHVGQHEQARLPLMQASQLQPQQRRIQSNVAVYLVMYGSETDAHAWMLQHQMTAAQREQVMHVAQKIAEKAAETSQVTSQNSLTEGSEAQAETVASTKQPEAIQAPKQPASEIAQLPVPALAPLPSEVASVATAPWMTEISRNGMAR